jgi:hypothetical protein
VSSIKPIHKDKHKNIKVKPNPLFLQSRNRHFVPITVHEFIKVSQDFPIVFVKDQETGQFRTVGLVGLKPGENLFYSDHGWQASYIPESLKTYPFLVARIGDSNSDQVAICIDEDSELINEREGEPLFDESGNHSGFVKAKGEHLVELLERNRLTQQFVEYLAKKKLLKTQTLTLNPKNDEESYDLTGLYVIDEQMLNQMPDSDFCELRKLGYMAPIYMALMSMHRVENLIKKSMSA